MFPEHRNREPRRRPISVCGPSTCSLTFRLATPSTPALTISTSRTLTCGVGAAENPAQQRGLALLRDRPSRLVERGVSNWVEAAGMGRQGYWPVPDTRLTRMHRRAFFIAALLPSFAGMLLLAARRRFAARENAALLAAAGLIVSNLVTVFFFLGDPRMRVPFDSLVLLLAAAGYLWLGERLQESWAALLRLPVSGVSESGQSTEIIPRERIKAIP